MTATKVQRRTLTARETIGQAVESAAYYAVVLGDTAEVRVEEDGPGSTPTHPFAVTANKTRAAS